MTTKPRSHLVLGLLGSGVLYYALDLSAPGRTAIDYTVIGLIAAAILWNLFRLGRDLYGWGGGRALWHLLRTLLFVLIGLFNTALIRPEDVGTWKNWLGWALLAVAALDTVSLFRKEKRALAARAGAEEEGVPE